MWRRCTSSAWFDGHGGAEGALHCAQTLHQRIVEAVAAHTSPAGTEVRPAVYLTVAIPAPWQNIWTRRFSFDLALVQELARSERPAAWRPCICGWQVLRWSAG